MTEQLVDVVEEAGVKIPMRDGVLLDAMVWRPTAPGRYPVLLERVAYELVNRSRANGQLYARQGYVVVAQNVLGSLANSHLFDFTHGWLYCIGVGICGGIATRQGAPLSIFLPAYKVAAAKP